MILEEFKKSIFKGLKFSFKDFLSVGSPEQKDMTSPELHSADQMKDISMQLVRELGGSEANSSMAATHIVIHQNEAAKHTLAKYRPD